jgi:hypothetical protein
MNRSCSDCTERRGYYLDAETIRNQQERIAELEAERNRWHVEQVHAMGNWRDAFSRVTELEAAIAKRDELIRDMLRTRCLSYMSCVDCEHERDEGCEFMTRATEMGVEL